MPEQLLAYMSAGRVARTHLPATLLLAHAIGFCDSWRVGSPCLSLAVRPPACSRGYRGAVSTRRALVGGEMQASGTVGELHQKHRLALNLRRLDAADAASVAPRSSFIAGAMNFIM